MTPEEKAKRYDEVLEELIGLLECIHEEKREILEEDITNIFPELKESSDERIRQELIAIYSVGAKANMKTGDIPDKDIVAWLEKQGENHDDKYNITGIKSKHAEGKLGEMIKEIKSADKAEPKFKVKYAGHDYNVLEIKDIAGVTFYGIEDEPNHIDYIKAENCERVKDEIEIPYGSKDSELQEATYYIPKGFYAEIDGDKVVIKKGEKPTEWSEEDNVMIRCITLDLELLKNRDDGKAGKAAYQSEIEWLKSLKPQNKWKPSGVQMTALDDVITNGHLPNVNQKNT